MPLALLAYLPAFYAWTAVNIGLYLWFVARHRRQHMAAALAALFPGAWSSVFAGQNGCLSFAILGGGLCLMVQRPKVAGLLLGLLIYKPQLAVMLPVALIAGRAWQTLTSALLSALLVIVLSALLFGGDSWLAFFEAMAGKRTELGSDVEAAP